MARYAAISAIGGAVIDLLKHERLGEKRVEIQDAQIELFRKPIPPARPLLALHLYRIAHTTRMRQPDRVVPQEGKIARPVHTVDLHYLLMVWAADPNGAQLVLGWAMKTLAENAYRLTATQLNNGAEVFFDDETIDFVPDNISLQDLTNIWEINKPDIQLSAAYVARAVTLHALQEPGGPGAVQSREPSFESTAPEDEG